MKKKLVIILSPLIIIVIGATSFFVANNPRYAFKSTYKFDLPDSSEIINFSRTYVEPSMHIKVKFLEEDYQTIKDGLLSYYQPKNLSHEIKDSETLPHFENNCSWWDMNTDEVVFAYTVMTKGKRGAMTAAYYSFIIKDGQNQFYLYCSNVQ